MNNLKRNRSTWSRRKFLGRVAVAGAGVAMMTNPFAAWTDQKIGFYYAVVDAMLKTGFNADEIGKIGGGNFCRVFDAATAGHS